MSDEVDTIHLKPWEPGYSAEMLPTENYEIRHRGTGTEESAKKRVANFGGRSYAELSPEERKAATKKAVATRKKNAALAAKQGKKATKKKKSKLVKVTDILPAADKLIQKGFDPMELLIDVAQGNALYDNHPFLPVLQEYLDAIEDCSHMEDCSAIRGHITRLRVESSSYLFDTYTPKEDRIKVATELMKYIRPQLKQVEHSSAQNQQPIEVVPLDENELKLFHTWFNEEY